jgi:hypothetical protein
MTVSVLRELERPTNLTERQFYSRPLIRSGG